MNIWRHLVNSYDNNRDLLKKSHPLSSTRISNAAEQIVVIVINGKGNFIRAYSIPPANAGAQEKTYISIPVSEASMARSSTSAWENPHPLFDQFEYVKGHGRNFEGLQTSSKQVAGYLRTLQNFANATDNSNIKAIASYVAKRSIEVDISHLKPKSKTMVLYEVEIPKVRLAKTWEDPSVYESWHNFYIKNKKHIIDGISGTEQADALFHPKKITNYSANAKLISANDNNNFTFRGRFESAKESVSVGYESSQKAHQFLRFLIDDRAVFCGEQAIMSFSIGSIEKDLPPPLDDEITLWDTIQTGSTLQTKVEQRASLQAETGHDYAAALHAALNGPKYRQALELHPETIILALDAATSGRMAITFYRHLPRCEYLDKLLAWHQDCKWTHTFKSRETGQIVSYIGAPFADRIIEAVFGRPRGAQDNNYAKLKKSARARLLKCVFDGSPLPTDYVAAPVRRVSNPQSITRKGKFDRLGFDQLLSTTCALIRKVHKQRTQEEIPLSLDAKRTDRDYLYGRLLGAADKLEEYALHKGQKDRTVTAAIRYMQALSQRPFSTWQTIHNCLLPYIQVVKGSFACQAIEEAKNLFISGDFEKDIPLDGSYLLGYYHQRARIDDLIKESRKSKKETQEEGDNE